MGAAEMVCAAVAQLELPLSYILASLWSCCTWASLGLTRRGDGEGVPKVTVAPPAACAEQARNCLSPDRICHQRVSLYSWL